MDNLSRLFLALYCCVVSFSTANGTIFNKFSDRTIGNETAYKGSTVQHEQQCLGQCMRDKKCVSFDSEESGNTIQCNFYNLTALENVGGAGVRALVSKPGTMYYQKQMASCADWYNAGVLVDGVREVVLLNRYQMNVLCVMGTGGGGWMAFQRRFDGSVSFSRTWNEYKNGFGFANSEYWLGLELLHEVTSSEKHDAMVIGKAFNNEVQTAFAKGFRIENEANDYTARFNEEVAGNKEYFNTFKNTRFSSPDNDNDNATTQHCAAVYDGGWWYGWCHSVAMNGRYPNADGTPQIFASGIMWKAWKDFTNPPTTPYSLKESTILVRPSSSGLGFV